jgi:hypothetical protein
MDTQVRFMKFGVKKGDNRKYAFDTGGTVWVNVEGNTWKSLEDQPQEIEYGLSYDELYQLLKTNRR